MSATEASGSKVSASLTGRVTQLSKALVKEKEKVSFVKKSAKTNLTKLKDNMNSDKVVAVANVFEQGRKRSNVIRKQHDEQHKELLEQHKGDLTTQANDHLSVLIKMKATAKSKVASVQVKGENKLVRSK